MPDTPTPGQVCYAAYTAALALTFPRPWDDGAPTMHAAWEAAAQAAITHWWQAHEAIICGGEDGCHCQHPMPEGRGF